MNSTLIMLPMELWLLIFRYTNTETFNIVMKFIKDYSEDFYRKLLLLVCKDIVKKNVKIRAMVNLFNDPAFYKCRNNYMYFKNLWFSSSEILHKDIRSIKKQHVEHSEAMQFKGYILNNNLITNEKNKRMFINLTFDRSDAWHKFTNNYIMNFYNNRIELDVVISNLLGLNK